MFKTKTFDTSEPLTAKGLGRTLAMSTVTTTGVWLGFFAAIAIFGAASEKIMNRNKTTTPSE